MLLPKNIDQEPIVLFCVVLKHRVHAIMPITHYDILRSLTVELSTQSPPLCRYFIVLGRREAVTKLAFYPIH